MVNWSDLATTSHAVVPSDGMDDHPNIGDGGEYGIHYFLGESNNTPSMSSKVVLNNKLMVHFSDEEPLDYGPSLIRDKEQEELEEQEKDVHSNSGLNFQRPNSH
jgi:hypothetical protein